MDYDYNITSNDAWNLDNFLKPFILEDLEREYLLNKSRVGKDVIKKAMFAFEIGNEPNMEDYDFSIEMVSLPSNNKSGTKQCTFEIDNENESKRYDKDLKNYEDLVIESIIVYSQDYLPYSKNIELKSFISRGIEVFHDMNRSGVSGIILTELEEKGIIKKPKTHHSDKELQIGTDYFNEILLKIKDGLISKDLEVHKEACFLFGKYYKCLWD